MRIAVVAPLVAPLLDAQAFGSHSLLTDLARGLESRGHQVRVFAAEGSLVPGVPVETIPTDPDLETALIVPGDVSRTSEIRAETSASMRRAFQRLLDLVEAWDPDAVSSHAFDAEVIELAEGLPVAHTLHLPPIVPSVVEAARHSSARFVSVSEASARLWTRAGVSSTTIRNGVPDLVAEHPEIGLDRAGLPLPVQPVALIAGRISREKGTAAGIQIARAAGLAPLVVGPMYDRPYAMHEVMPLLGSGEWLPPVDRATLSHLMSIAAVTLMPIDWDEPFGLVAAEAQLAGCPVAAYRRGALPEIVRDGLTGILADPGDEQGLVQAIWAVASLDRAAIRLDALTRLSVGPMLDAYERLLSELVEAPAAPTLLSGNGRPAA